MKGLGEFWHYGEHPGPLGRGVGRGQIATCRLACAGDPSAWDTVLASSLFGLVKHISDLSAEIAGEILRRFEMIVSVLQKRPQRLVDLM